VETSDRCDLDARAAEPFAEIFDVAEIMVPDDVGRLPAASIAW